MSESMDSMFTREIPKSCKSMQCLESNVSTAMYYNELWHSRLPKTNMGNLLRNKHSVFYTAVYELSIYAVAMWTTPVVANRMTNGFQMLELRRLAIAPDAPKYTATWMLGKMIKNIHKQFPDIIKLISYQDTEVHTGTIYAAGNWKLESTTKYKPWNTQTRTRVSIVQSKADKNRWVYELSVQN